VTDSPDLTDTDVLIGICSEFVGEEYLGEQPEGLFAAIIDQLTSLREERDHYAALYYE